MKLAVSLSLYLTCMYTVNAANILAVFPTPSPSHYILGSELIKGLIKKGHHVTMASPYKMTEKLDNYTDIVLEGMVEFKEAYLQKLMNSNVSIIRTFLTVIKMDFTPRITLESSGMKALLKSNKRFDVIVLDAMTCEALLVLGHIFKAPVVIAASFGSLPVNHKMIGSSSPYAYVPSGLTTFTDEMTFLERVANTALHLIMDAGYYYLFLNPQRNILQEYFPDAPPLDDLIHNVSVMLLNAHYSVLETPRPYLPNMIPVGGLHIQPQTLPEELKQFLDGAKDGAVLFSLGSNARSTDLPPERLSVILKSFAKFPQKFLWKFEDDSLDVPNNVKIMKWLPQRAVLDHPNVNAFISHGGLLSVTEAVYYGVPFIGVPVFGDQEYNTAIAVRKNFAIRCDLNTLTEESFTEAIREILENPIYKKTIKQRSSLFRNQPIPPLDLAIYWVEHVIKYKGAPYLQNAGIKLKWWQSRLLDVIAFLSVVCSIIIYVNYLIVKKCLRFVCNRFCRKQKLKSS